MISQSQNMINKQCIICNTTTVKNPAKHWFAGPKCDRCYRREQYNKPNSKKKQYERKHRSETKETIREKAAKYVADKSANDLNFYLKRIIRRRISMAAKRINKTGSSVKDLGCSIEDLRKHLESQFKSNMTWDNYGVGGWEIDHIRPLSGFDLSNREEFLVACNYVNLQPLWKKDHMIKTHNERKTCTTQKNV